VANSTIVGQSKGRYKSEVDLGVACEASSFGAEGVHRGPYEKIDLSTADGVSLPQKICLTEIEHTI
jgi:hypothetical protein